MRIASPNATLFLALFASMLLATRPDTARSQPPDSERAKIDAVAKRRAFYLPPDAEEVTDKRERLRALKPVWICAGGTVTDPSGPGPFFVEAGGTYYSVGGQHVVIVKKGGKASAFGGKSLVFYEKGADISGAEVYPGNTLIGYDSISFEKLEPFTLKGTVTGANGELAAGTKVHAYDVGMLYLQSMATKADGTFVFRFSTQT